MRPMKKLVRILALSALVATIWLPALARNTQPFTTTTVQQGDEEAKAALYQKFLDLYKKDPKAANDVAKEYLQKYPAESDQTAYLKKWSTAYEAKEKDSRKANVEDLLRQQKYADAFAAAKAILAEEPADVRTLNNAVFAALYAAGVNKNESFNGEAANYARKAVQLIQSGQPFEKRDDTLGWLNSALGFFSLKTNPTEAVSYYIKAAGFEGAAKKDPQTYLFLADAYRNAEYTKLASDIKTRCSTAEQQATPDCKTLSDRLNQVVDRMIDAYARAIALATDPKYARLKSDAMTDLTAFYKFRHEGSDTGLNEFIAGVLSKPLPTEPIGAGSSGTASTTPATPQSSNNGTTGTGTTTNTTTTTTNTSTPTSTNPAPKTTTPASTTTGKTPKRR
jgi:tetratricopeptide (TPR) repeat protein